MSTATYGIIEILIFFGGIFAFALYQLRAVRRAREEDERRDERGEVEPAEPTREDIFWREMTRRRPER